MNIILSSVRMATPLIFLALAELYSQRAGLVHIGLEGLASIGSLVGFLVSLITGSPMLGVLAGAAVVMAYTGLLLQSMRAVALWHSPWLPALFVLSSLSCGFALVVGAAQFSEAAGAFASVLSRSALADAGVIVAEALAAVALLATVAHAAQAGGANGTTVAAAESVRQLACGVQAPLFWGGFVTLGLAIPLCIEVAGAMLHRLPSVAILGLAASVLVGGSALRWSVANAGMHPVLSVLSLG